MRTKPNPEEVQKVLDALSRDEIAQIKKENPFRYERNAKIYKLLKRGVKISIVSEISGLSQNTILRINARKCKLFE